MTRSRSVLALEFRGVGDTADFGFLAADAGEVELSRIDPLVHHIERPLTLSEQARLIVGTFSRTPGLVLAYCGTSALALHIAALTDAPALLVDPYPITAEDMHRDVGKLCAAMDVDPALLGDPGAEPDLARWEAALLTARDSMAGVHGGDEEAYELVDDVLDRYRAWLRFLRAGVEAGPVSTSGEVTVVTARPAEVLVPLLTAPHAVSTHRLADGAGVLDAPEVRALLSAAVHRHEEE